MAVNVIIFGSLRDIAGESVQVERTADTDALMRELTNRYPGLKHSKYIIAVNRKMVSSNTSLTDNDTVALLPPYSGG